MSQATFLYLTLDLLGPEYTTGKVHLALTQTASLETGGTIDCPDLLKPWTWTDGTGAPPPKMVRLFYRKAAHDWQPVSSPLNMIDPPGRNVPLENELNDRFETLNNDHPALLVFNPQAGGNDAGVRWPHLLESALRLPLPLGAQLRLTRFVEVEPEIVDGKEIVAAPIFKADGVMWEPSGVIEYESNGLRKITYTPAGDRTLTAWTPGYKPHLDRQVQELQERTESYLDFNTLWIKLPRQLSGRAWLGEFPYEAADAADLAQHLLGALEDLRRWLSDQQKGQDSPRGLVPWKFAKFAANAIFLALRLAAHSGVTKDNNAAPALPRTAAELLSRLGLDASEFDKLIKYEIDHDPSLPLDQDKLDKWKDLLIHLAVITKNRFTDPKASSEEDAVPLASLIEGVHAIASRVRGEVEAQQILAAHWSEARLNPEPEKLFEAARGLQLRRRLILDRLDDPWRKMTRTDTTSTRQVGNEAVEMRTAFFKALWAFAQRALGFGVLETTPPQAPVDSHVYLCWRLGDNLRKRLEEATKTLGPETSAGSQNAAPGVQIGSEAHTASAHPLSLVAGQLRTPETEPTMGDDFGPSARVSGIGVLLRQRNRTLQDKGYGPWRCLTMARPLLNGTTKLADYGLAPVPIVEMCGLESWNITYDNHPLTARSLAEQLAHGVHLDDPKSPENQLNLPVTLPVQLDQVPNDGNAPDWAYQLPMLKYGQYYEIACFAVTNAGALPKELSETGKPYALADPSKTNPPGDFVQSEFVRQLRYLRRTGVGAPRLAAANKADQNAPPDSKEAFSVVHFDSNVSPRSLDLSLDDDIGALVLLVPNETDWVGKDKFSFSVHPPAVDVEVWHRWKAMDLYEGGYAQNDNLVAQVWHELRSKAPKPDDDPQSPRIDLSLDDPAVECLGFLLVDVSDAGTPKKVGDWTALPLYKSAKQDVLNPVQAMAGPVTVSVVGSRIAHGLKLSPPTTAVPNGWPLRVSVHSGKIYQLKVASLVATKRYPGGGVEQEQRFSNKPMTQFVFPPPAPWTAAAVTSLTIEVATEDLVDEKALRRAIRVLGQRGDEIIVGIDPTDDPKFDHVKNVRLERQMWSWRGRRLTAPFPTDALFPQNSIFALEEASSAWLKLQEWDAAGFGDRSDENHLIQESMLPGPARRGADTLAVGAALHRISLTSDRRAQYWRYRAEAHSRYAALMTSKKGVVRSGEWKRLVIKDRLIQPLPRPRLRFVLPLTQPVTGDSAKSGWAAPLLALFDETWSATAGPGERLGVELVTTASGWQEFGPDPIDSAQGAGGNVDALPEGQPFGLTFDVDAEAGLPATTAWEIRIQGASVRPGAFAQLRFKRTVDPALDHETDVRASQFTDGYWTQLLPDFTRWQVKLPGDTAPKVVKAEDLSLAPDSGKLQMELDGNFVDAVVQPNLPGQLDDESPRKRKVYVLVTRMVQEAASPFPSELPLYLGVIDKQALPTYAPNFDAKVKEKRARLIEVEFHQGTTIGDGKDRPLAEHPLFKALFGDLEEKEDTAARIVRVSPPIGEMSE